MHTFTYLSLALVLTVISFCLTDNSPYRLYSCSVCYCGQLY